MALSSDKVLKYLHSRGEFKYREKWTDGYIQETINKVLVRLSEDIVIPSLQRNYNQGSGLTISSGTAQYTIDTSPERLSRIMSAVFQGASVKRELDMKYGSIVEVLIKTNITQSTPLVIGFLNNQILIHPIPNEAGTLYFTYQAVAQKVEDIDDEFFSIFADMCEADLIPAYTPPGMTAEITIRDDVDKQLREKQPQLAPQKENWGMRLGRFKKIQEFNDL